MELVIASNRSPYAVKFFENLKEVVQAILEDQTKTSACIIDANVIRLYPHLYQDILQRMPVLSFEATEQNKDLSGLFNILAFIQKEGLNKKSNLIVIGGGITQDVASLAAQLYYRGIPYILIPTTLLSMADSCIGSKSSLNFNGFKNQLGGFSPPHKVFISTEFLETLGSEDLYSGLGEIFKLFIIDQAFTSFNLEKAIKNKVLLTEYIFKSLAIKKCFIEQDEFDQGIRRILNYGHTFGHALEVQMDYQIPHGLAVVLGIDIANYFSFHIGALSESLYTQIQKKIKNFYSWENLDFSRVNADTLLNNIKQDKKLEDDYIHMILLSDQKGIFIRPLKLNKDFNICLAEYLQTSNIILKNLAL